MGIAIITKRNLIKASKNTAGIATLVARNLGVTREGLCNKLSKKPELKQILIDAREMAIDQAEAKLVTKVKEGNWQAIQLTLKTIGKNRGYIEKVETEEVGNANRNDLINGASILNDILTPAQKKQLAALMRGKPP